MKYNHRTALPVSAVLVVLLLLLVPVKGQAQAVDGFFQDIRDRITKREFFKVNGSLQTNLRWNRISGIPGRTQPFSGRLSAGLLVDILSIKGNFSAAFSDGNLNYNLPAYAFYGFSPSYKWIQLHLGDRSLELSPYTLSGHNFKGVGVELQPGKFRFVAFTGRLRAARQADAGAIQNLDPIYKRWGQGVKVGYDDGDNQLGIVVFHARDDSTSLLPVENSGLRPQENLVLEFQGKKKIGNRFDIGFQLARSAWTRDRGAPYPTNGSEREKKMLGLFNTNGSSAYGNAWNFEIGYTPSFARFSLVAERLDAGYQSLGRLSFLNDTENLRLNGSTTLFQDKVNLAGSFGVQRNGLYERGAISGNRLIGSLNLGVNVSERLLLNVSFSNINYTLRQRVSTVPVLVVDSIVIVQNNFSTQLSGNLLLGEQRRSTLMLAVAFQRAGTQQAIDQLTAQPNDFYSAVAAYSWTEEEQGWNVTLSCVSSRTAIDIIDNTIISPSLNIAKVVLEDRLNVDAGAAYSFVFGNLGNRTGVWETRVGGTYRMGEKHNFRTRISYVSNRTTSELAAGTVQAFEDLNAQLTYQLNF